MISLVSSPEEIAAASSLARDIWKAHYIPIIGDTQVEYMLERFQSETAIADQIRAGMVYALIDPGSGPAGYLAYETRGSTVFLSKLYVAESNRRQGLARRALDWIADRERPKRIELTVNRRNTASIAAYHRLGFRIEANVIADIGGGFVMDDHRMARDLGS